MYEDEEQVFLSEILKDETPTSALVFADWLEEKEDPRVKKIRWWVAFCEHYKTVEFWKGGSECEVSEEMRQTLETQSISLTNIALGLVLLHRLVLKDHPIKWELVTHMWPAGWSNTRVQKFIHSCLHTVEWSSLDFSPVYIPSEEEEAGVTHAIRSAIEEIGAVDSITRRTLEDIEKITETASFITCLLYIAALPTAARDSARNLIGSIVSDVSTMVAALTKSNETESNYVMGILFNQLAVEGDM